MKINAWLRFGLIVLCLAMAMSMFACGNTGDETTEAPKTETTEAPTSAPTEAPTQAPTEAPTQAPTEAPTQAPTEAPTQAPTEEPTQAPTEAPTQAPTEEPTQAPTEEPTQAPTEAPTQAPTEEPTEEPTEPAEDNKDEAIANIDVFFGKTELELVTPNDGLYAEPTDDGVLYINDFNMDGNFTLFMKRAAEDGPTGQYFFIKYKASAKTYIQLFTAVDSAVPTGNRCYTLNNTNYLVNDEEWHIAIVDMAAFAKSGIYAGTDGKFYVQHLRLDIEGGEGIWAEIAYVGYESDIADIIALAQAYDNEAALQAMCACSALTSTATFTDKDTHAATCSLCGKTSAVAHSGAAAGVWNGKYYESNSACTVCGEKYNFGANLFAEAESLDSFAQNAWNTAPLTGIDENGVTYAGLYSKNAAGAWSNGYFFINPTGAVTGQYVVFRYQLSGGEGDRDFELMIDTAGGYAGKVSQTLVNDGEWHIAVYDFTNAASCAPDANGNYVLSNNGRPNLTPWNANEGIMFDWIATYDDIERMPLEYRYILNPDYVEPEETEAPTEEPTEAPTEVETEEPVEIVEPNKYFAGNDFGSMTTVVLEKEATADGYKFTNAANNDAYIVFFEKNTDVTGQYLFFKYRANEAGWTVWASTTNASAVWGDHYGWAPIGDGEWHLAVIDLSKTNPVKTNDDGKYAVKYIRLDIEGSAGVWAEFAYVGVAEDLAGLGAYLRATDASVKDICPCPAGSQNPNPDGTTTCEVCGKKGIYMIEYTGPTYKYTIDGIGSVRSQGGSNGQVQYNRGDIMVDPLTQTLSFSGWCITEQGMSKYMYRFVVNGEAQAWNDWAHAGTSPSDIQGAVGSSYPSWNKEQAAYGSRFAVTVTADLAAWHGKQVDIEFVAVTRAGIVLPIFTAYNITPEHGGIGGYVDNGDGTHNIQCVGCDYLWKFEEAHEPDIPIVGTWNETTGQYEDTCKFCNAVVTVEFQTIVDYSRYAEGHRFPNNGSRSGIVSNGVLVVTNNGNTGWGGISVGQVGEFVGQYYVMKYRIPEGGSNGAATVNIALRLGNKTQTVTMIADGAWHYAILNLTSMSPSNGVVSTVHGSAGDHWFLTYVDGNCYKFEVAFEGFVETLDRIPDQYCEHPEWACELQEYKGVEGHTVKCTICEQIITEAHTPSNTYGTKGTDGYVKICAVCNGATDIATYGNVYVSASAIAKSTKGAVSIKDNGDYATITKVEGDSWFIFFKDNATIETGKYVLIKYRNVDFTEMGTYSACTTYYSPTGPEHVKLYNWVSDTDTWHYMIVDMAAKSGYWTEENGVYSANYFRLNWSGEGDIAYVVIANDIETLCKSIQTLDSSVADACDCLAITRGDVEYIDATSHGTTCNLCGKTETVAHTAAYGVWNETEGKYLAVCGVCNGNTNIDYGCTVKATTKQAFVSSTVWSGAVSVTEGEDYDILNIKSSSYTASAFRPNPNGYVTGQYLVIRYRVPLAEGQTAGNMGNGSMYLGIQSATGASATNYYWSFIADDNWHEMIIDCSTLAGFTANADGTYTFAPNSDTRSILQGWDYTRYNGTIYIAGVEFYDSMDRMPEWTYPQ